MNPERKALINELMLDMIANTDCSWAAATAAVAFWESHYANGTAPIYGVVEYSHHGGTEERPNVAYESGDAPRSLKVGAYVIQDCHWFMTIHS